VPDGYLLADFAPGTLSSKRQPKAEVEALPTQRPVGGAGASLELISRRYASPAISSKMNSGRQASAETAQVCAMIEARIIFPAVPA
jgi:hypothetical protein